MPERGQPPSVHFEVTEERPIGSEELQQELPNDPPTSPMSWTVLLPMADVEALIVAAQTELRCIGEAGEDRRLTPVALGLRLSDGRVHTIRLSETGDWYLSRWGQPEAWRLQDTGFGARFAAVKARVASGGTSTWRRVDSACPPAVPAGATLDAVSAKRRWRGLGAARQSTYEWTREGAQTRYVAWERSAGRGSARERSWTGEVDSALLDALAAAAIADVHCGPADPSHRMTDNYPRLEMALAYSGGVRLQVGSTSQGPYGAPWWVRSIGSEAPPGAQDSGAIGIARNALVKATDEAAPEWQEADSRPGDRR